MCTVSCVLYQVYIIILFHPFLHFPPPLLTLSLSLQPHPDSIDNTLDDLYLSLTDHWASSEYEISFPAHSLLLVRAKPLINHYKVEMKGVVGYISPSAVRPVTQDDVKEKDRADVINGLKFKAAPVGVMTCPAFAMDDRASARSGGSSGGKASSNSGKKGKETASRPRFTESLRIALGGGGSEMSLPSMGSASLERRGSLSSVTFGQEKVREGKREGKEKGRGRGECMCIVWV